MLSLNHEMSNEFLWDCIQEPARPSLKSADFMRLLAALDSGWQIVEAAYWFSAGSHQADFYLLTIFHPRKLTSRPFGLRRSPEADALLKNEAITLIDSQPGD